MTSTNKIGTGTSEEKSLACALVCDHNLAIPAGGLAARIAKLWNVDVHIFVERPEGNRDPITETKAARVTYHYEELFAGFYHLLPDHPRFSRAAWGRVFLPAVLSDYCRILYCDIDVLPGLLPAGLCDIDLPHGIAMVRGTSTFGSDTSLHTATQFPDLSFNTKWYYNSGVMLIDPAKFDVAALLPHLNDFMLSVGKNSNYPDQDFLNYYFREKTVELSPNLNFQQSLMALGLCLNTEPAIRHFCHSVKPYHNFPEHGVSEITRKAKVEFHAMVEEAGLIMPMLKSYDRSLLFRSIKAFGRYTAERNGIKLPKSRELEARWWDQRKQALQYLRDGVEQGRFADVNVFDLNPPEPHLRFNGLEVLPSTETM